MLLLGWTALVVIGTGRAPTEDEWLTLPDLGWLVVATAGLLALTGLVILIVFRPTALAMRHGRKPLSPWKMILAAIILVVVAAVLDPPEISEELAPAAQEEEAAEGSAGSGTADSISETANEPGVILLVLLGAVAAVAFIRSRQRVSPAAWVPPPPPLPAESEVEAALEEAGDLLVAHTDPRLAVLASYASLEAAMAAHGQPRRPTETPIEHMARALAAVPVVARPAVSLGQLYEVARFSNGPITGDDKDRAARELAAAKEALQARPLS